MYVHHVMWIVIDVMMLRLTNWAWSGRTHSMHEASIVVGR